VGNPGRQKVGTVLDEEVFRKAKQCAAADGKTLSSFIEEALMDYMVRRETGQSAVDRMWGLFRLPPDALREVVEADVYES